jgi:hypothetical protein
MKITEFFSQNPIRFFINILPLTIFNIAYGILFINLEQLRPDIANNVIVQAFSIFQIGLTVMLLLYNIAINIYIKMRYGTNESI